MEKIKAFGKEKELAQWLSCFERISVRDSNSLAVVKGLLGGEVESNLDPVLMYDFQKEIANCSLTEEQKRQMSKPYMIVYAYPNRLEAQEIETLRQYAADRGLQIYGISGYQSYADEMIYASPLEVLAYFAHAECVVTDTFHGTIFSVINQKPFVTLVRKSVNGSYGNQEKLEDLLNKLHLSQRCTFDPSNMVDILRTPIQFEEANAVIKTERVKRMSYLTEVVNACKD